MKESTPAPLVEQNTENSIYHGKRLCLSSFVLEKLVEPIFSLPFSRFFSVFLIILELNEVLVFSLIIGLLEHVLVVNCRQLFVNKISVGSFEDVLRESSELNFLPFCFLVVPLILPMLQD